STRFLEACTPREAALFFEELGGLTQEAVSDIERRTGEPSRIDSFVGDGFLTFFAESDPSAVDRSGPARALIVAKMLRREFRAFCQNRFGRFGESARARLRELRLVAAITHGPVL